MIVKYGGYFHGREIPTPRQCRAAKAMACIGFRELAAEAETSTRTLIRYITHGKPVYPQIIERVRAAFEQRGVYFWFGEHNAGIQFKSDSLAEPLPAVTHRKIKSLSLRKEIGANNPRPAVA